MATATKQIGRPWHTARDMREMLCLEDDTLLCVQHGRFYSLYGQDARVVARILSRSFVYCTVQGESFNALDLASSSFETHKAAIELAGYSVEVVGHDT